MRQFKTFSARRINTLRGTPGASVWQRNYYEHIIRNDESLNIGTADGACWDTAWGMAR